MKYRIYCILFVTFTLLFVLECTTMRSSWNKTTTEDRIESYEQFLKIYPESEFSHEARSRLEKLSFEKSKEINTIVSYRHFLKLYTEGMYVNKAHSRLEQLYYQKAKDINTIASYEGFLNRYPESNFLNEVQLQLEQSTLNKTKAINTNKMDCTGYVTDIEGNEYQTVMIDKQCWMVDNLAVSHYRNGDSIPKVQNIKALENLKTGAWCYYDNNPRNDLLYGKLYNWYAIDDSRCLSPEGWHIPTDEEWEELEKYLGMNQSEAEDSEWRGTNESNKLKEVGILHWEEMNIGATNESGFSALPGGGRYGTVDYGDMGYAAYFWTSTEYDSNYAWNRILTLDNSRVYRGGNFSKHFLFSIRCIKN